MQPSLSGRIRSNSGREHMSVTVARIVGSTRKNWDTSCWSFGGSGPFGPPSFTRPTAASTASLKAFGSFKSSYGGHHKSSKARWPRTHSSTTDPSDQASAKSPRYDASQNNSGAKKPGLPTKSVSSWPDDMSAQSPKSHNLIMPASGRPLPHVAGEPSTSTFSGFTSLCAMPRWWQCRKASAAILAIATTTGSGQPRGWPSRKLKRSRSPASMKQYTYEDDWTTSYNRHTPSCRNRFIASTSRLTLPMFLLAFRIDPPRARSTLDFLMALHATFAPAPSPDFLIQL
mmetsp:Transcript_21460/g.60514  ORF Transcript_21460/g.60514 Transcript_21460/m.60514 type:complete len:286 (+) Transcript_21460:298-1155(+)